MNRELTLGNLIKTKPCPLFDDELMMRNQLRKTVSSDDWWIETIIRKLRSASTGVFFAAAFTAPATWRQVATLTGTRRQAVSGL